MSERRYPGVKPFEKTDRDRFFGRTRDVRDLYGMIQMEKLVVLFGKSGYGKSSLLNAGVLPKFTEERPGSGRQYQPIVVRLGAFDKAKQPPVEEVIARMGEQIKVAKEDQEQVDKQTAFLDKLRADSNYPETLWMHFKKCQHGKQRQFLLVFDQFEEFSSYPLTHQERFINELAELLYTDIPQALFDHFDELQDDEQVFLSEPLDIKAVFAIRSDRMHLLDRLKDKLPAILHKRYELKAMDREQAREAIAKPAMLEGDFLSQRFEYEPDSMVTILDKLSRTEATSDVDGEEVVQLTTQTGIEAFQLQILCQYFEDQVMDGLITDHSGDNIPDVRAEDLPDLSTIYETYYRRRLQDLPEKMRYAARLLIENGLLAVDQKSGEARRMSTDGFALVAQMAEHGATQELLGELEKTYLIRREVSSTGGFNYEISHDTLIAPILNSKRQREEAEEKAEAARKAKAEREEAEKRAKEAEAKVAAEAARRKEAEKLQKEAEAGRRRANIFSLLFH